MCVLEKIEGSCFQGVFAEEAKGRAVAALEGGRVLFFPTLDFVVREDERVFLDPRCSDGRAKNVSYDPRTHKLRGSALHALAQSSLKAMVARYAQSAQALVAQLLPGYRPSLRAGRTSYRPVEVTARSVSYRKDDSRLHVDAFPSRPTRGERILRLFTNVNPHAQSRLWRIGEPFEVCALRFLPRLSKPLPGKSQLLRATGLTRGYRSAYDHYMLGLHDAMKRDVGYQRQCPQYEVAFPAGTSWMVFTDQVSHAATAGQYLFEQTFYLRADDLRDPSSAPSSVLERLLGRPLIPRAA